MRWSHCLASLAAMVIVSANTGCITAGIALSTVVIGQAVADKDVKDRFAQIEGKSVEEADKLFGERFDTLVNVRNRSEKLVIYPVDPEDEEYFYVIVPLEYRAVGAPPVSWFIHDLMKAMELPYYVSLLSAAALHGASHQQPQTFQVMTDRSLRSVLAGRTTLRVPLLLREPGGRDRGRAWVWRRGSRCRRGRGRVCGR